MSKWIPFKTGTIDGVGMWINTLPDDGQSVLVSDGKYIFQDEFVHDADGTCYFDNGHEILEGMAWMPLPGPYDPAADEEGQSDTPPCGECQHRCKNWLNFRRRIEE